MVNDSWPDSDVKGVVMFVDGDESEEKIEFPSRETEETDEADETHVLVEGMGVRRVSSTLVETMDARGELFGV